MPPAPASTRSVESSPPGGSPLSPLRHRLTLAYDGHDLHGWQKQHPPQGEPLRTVQQVVEDALIRLLGQRVNLVGASRTDAGVHAIGQVATFDAVTPIPRDRILRALNDRLPDDVEARDLGTVGDHFDVIGHARRKRYRYRVHTADRKPIEKRRFVNVAPFDLDPERMHAAAARLVGTHDFAAFAQASHGRRSTVRTIFDCRVLAGDAVTDAANPQPGSQRGKDPDPSRSSPIAAPATPGTPWFPGDAGEELHILVEGDGFLYNMVRIIAGTLMDIGRGNKPPEVVTDMLLTGDRALGGFTAPPEGLCLERIWY